MSTTATAYALPGSATAPKAEEAGEGFFDRAFSRLVAARMADADRMIRQHMAGYSDDQLVAMGLSKAEIAELRKLRHVPMAFWL
ncbi:MAG: hypothetical protein AB7K67_06775 [Hyphomicrobiaceae bacterium]|jgi:hypothetical protein